MNLVRFSFWVLELAADMGLVVFSFGIWWWLSRAQDFHSMTRMIDFSFLKDPGRPDTCRNSVALLV